MYGGDGRLSSILLNFVTLAGDWGWAMGRGTVRSSLSHEGHHHDITSANHNAFDQVFGVVQMIVSCVAISYGFGKSTAILSAAQVVNAEKVRLSLIHEHPGLLPFPWSLRCTG